MHFDLLVIFNYWLCSTDVAAGSNNSQAWSCSSWCHLRSLYCTFARFTAFPFRWMFLCWRHQWRTSSNFLLTLQWERTALACGGGPGSGAFSGCAGQARVKVPGPTPPQPAPVSLNCPPILKTDLSDRLEGIPEPFICKCFHSLSKGHSCEWKA